MKRYLFILLSVFSILEARPCTAVIASGKVTADGRPFIFKNRDASEGIDNSLLVLKGTKYQFVGVVNYSTSASPTSVWYGHNEAGFAILNTLSYYFNSATSKANTSAGALMKKALGQCATVDEFEALLKQTQAQTSSLTLSTNFAVMDSLGNVAVFETSNRSYTKFDVNDETVAPKGYLVRTNFSFTSPYYDTTNHVGEQRYNAACKYIEDTFSDEKIDAVKLAHELPRYLYHGDRKVNLWDEIPADIHDVHHVYFSNFIPRFTSTSASLIQGVLEGEKATNTVDWLTMGWPCGSLTVPIVITPSLCLPNVVKRAAGTYKSKMCSDAVELKNRVFAVYHNDKQSTDSIDLSKLINKENTGILQKITLADQEVCERGLTLLTKMRNDVATEEDVAAYYDWIDNYWQQVFDNVVSGINTIDIEKKEDTIYFSIKGISYPKKPSSQGIYINNRRKVLVK